MSLFWLLVIGFFIFVIAIIGVVAFLYFFLRSSDSDNDYADSYVKGKMGELFVLNELNNWASRNMIPAKANLYRTHDYGVQEIDIEFDIYISHNVGIEVKFRTIDHITYLMSEHISRVHKDDNRQCSKQLHGYVKQNKCLGLYAFVFSKNSKFELYFIPHYVLEKLIVDVNGIVYIDNLKRNPHTYHWEFQNSDFVDYIDREYQNQYEFFYPKKKFRFFGLLRRNSNN